MKALRRYAVGKGFEALLTDKEANIKVLIAII